MAVAPFPLDLNVDEYRRLAEFRYQIRRFLQFSERAARDAGLEPQQHQLLLTVRGLPADLQPTIGELANRLLLRHHSTVELVDRLEQLGAVRREPDPEDRRAVLVRLTRKGESLLHRLTVAHREELDANGPELARAIGAVLRRQRKGKQA
jgi:DNA-binding MarR family transcriptional regulator